MFVQQVDEIKINAWCEGVCYDIRPQAMGWEGWLLQGGSSAYKTLMLLLAGVVWRRDGMEYECATTEPACIYIYVARCVEQRCACFSIVGCLLEQEAVWCLVYGSDSTLLPERSMCYSWEIDWRWVWQTLWLRIRLATWNVDLRDDIHSGVCVYLFHFPQWKFGLLSLGKSVVTVVLPNHVIALYWHYKIIEHIEMQHKI